jgi:hypothetical protein
VRISEFGKGKTKKITYADSAVEDKRRRGSAKREQKKKKKKKKLLKKDYNRQQRQSKNNNIRATNITNSSANYPRRHGHSKASEKGNDGDGVSLSLERRQAFCLLSYLHQRGLKISNFY